MPLLLVLLPLILLLISNPCICAPTHACRYALMDRLDTAAATTKFGNYVQVTDGRHGMNYVVGVWVWFDRQLLDN